MNINAMNNHVMNEFPYVQVYLWVKIPKELLGRGGAGVVYAFAMLIYSAKFLFKEALLIYIPASIIYAYMFCPGLTCRVCS